VRLFAACGSPPRLWPAMHTVQQVVRALSNDDFTPRTESGPVGAELILARGLCVGPYGQSDGASVSGACAICKPPTVPS
jgi:hypothetical protein